MQPPPPPLNYMQLLPRWGSSTVRMKSRGFLVCRRALLVFRRATGPSVSWCRPGLKQTDLSEFFAWGWHKSSGFATRELTQFVYRFGSVQLGSSFETSRAEPSRASI
jgi:hypothetical protein